MQNDLNCTLPAYRAVVFCRDARLTRLLETELSLCGVAVVPETEGEACDLILWDMDDFSRPVAVEGHTAFLGFSRHTIAKISVSEEERACYLHRPFDLKDFENAVRLLLFGEDLKSLDRGSYFPLPVTAHLSTQPAEKERKRPKADAQIPRLSVSEDQVFLSGEIVPLTPREYALFSCLWEHRGEAVPKAVLWDALCAAVEDGTPATNTLEVYICHLRRKLERSSAPRLITTVRGVGYRLNE